MPSCLYVGTTGRPKGAVLSHDNLIWRRAPARFDGLRATSCLPLMAWVGDHIFLRPGYVVGLR
jgi:long-subunit acyl-CoA synthetase (AMP-forming)